MTFRVTPQQFVSNTIRFSQLRNRNLNDLQQQVSTGLRIHKPSDDPAQIASLMANRAHARRIEVDLDNVDTATAKLNHSVSQLESANDVLTLARSRLMEGRQSGSDTRAIASEVQGLIDQMIRIANAAHGGNALFGGTNSDLSPFSVVESDTEGRPARVAYSGAAERASIVVGSIAVDVHYPGSEIFSVVERKPTVFLGDTGVRPGVGTDSDVGRGQLVVSHTLTEYRGASGAASGLSSDQDTLIGIHELTYDSVAGTLSLGANTVSFNPGDRDVRVTSVDGGVIHVDTTGLVGAGTIEVVGHGTLSVDGGVSSVDIDFSSNQIVMNSTSGAVTNVDTSDMKKAGVVHTEYFGTTDVFQVLINLRDDLLNTRGLTDAEFDQSMGRNLIELDRILANIADHIGEQAASSANLDNMKLDFENSHTETQIQVSDMESVDFAEAAIRLQQEQNALQYTYAASIGLLDLSILDFLQ